MKIAFRVDASTRMGTGHVARCLALAEVIRERGVETVFICREHAGNLCDLIESSGHRVLRLPLSGNRFHDRWNDHAPWLGANRLKDSQETQTALSAAGQFPDWLVIDHYAIDREWEVSLRPAVGRIAVIDDLADRPHDCDLLLDQNLHYAMETRYEGLLPAHCRQLLGPKYALLRPEFAAERNRLRLRDGSVGRILVSFGGSDAGNETEKALQAILRAGLCDLTVDVVVGASNPHRQEVESLCATLPQARFHCQVSNMAELMAAADLSLCAAGTSTWERCALGLPSLVVAVAHNQESLAACGAEEGLFFYLGTSTSATVERLRDALRVLSSSPGNLRAFSARSLAAVDGRGTQRVAEQLIPPSIRLRQAGWEDCEAVLEWRNAEATRRYTFDPEPVPRDTHLAWFRGTLEDPNRALLIGEIDCWPVGVLRYDFCGEAAVISVFLVPGRHGRGIGAQLIRSGSLWLKENRPGIRTVNAEILSLNTASAGAFAKAGFLEHHLTYREVLR